MKKIILCLLIIFTAKVFSQTDSSYKTDKIFYISYLNYNKEIEKLDDVCLTDIDSISLTFEQIIYGQNSNMNKYVSKKIVFDRIDKFGYKIGPSKGSIIGTSALIGFGLGFVLGAIEGKFNPVGDGSRKPDFADHVGTGFLFGTALAIPTTLIGIIISIPVKEYETLDISKYNRQKKFEILKRLIRNGVKRE
ncbi:MAG: hypothetical protein JST55_11220 [Bacteroidetes bacterium]|nr:hypothetical protein [Bacteroidota bacterium]